MKPLFTFLLVLTIFATSIGFLLGFSSGSRNVVIGFLQDAELLRTPSRPVATYSHGIIHESVYQNAIARTVVSEKINPRSAIVAHHLIVADAIADVLARLSSEKVQTVFVLSPNHFSKGQSAIQVGNVAFETPFGLLEPESDAIDTLLASGISVAHEYETFQSEHGISGLTPFLVHYFPSARIVPLVIDESLSPQDGKALAQAIYEEFPESLVIGSIDMSHNLPHEVARFHDEVTKRYIATGGCEQENCAIDLEIDANAVLNIVLEVNRLRGTQQWTLTHHDSSLNLGVVDDFKENTSHIIGYFENGVPTGESFAAIHLLGDIMLDRGVRVLTNRHGIDFPWRELSRFTRGAHKVMANLEGTVNEQESTYTYNPPFRFVFSLDSARELAKFVDVVSLANNHSSDVGSAGERETQSWLNEFGVKWFGGYRTPEPIYEEEINGQLIAVIGYHQFQPNIPKLETMIHDAKSRGAFVIVHPHWGNEYIRSPQLNQQELARVMIAAGADLIIGGHPHVVQGAEMIDGVPVIYSLGNFIFDQQIPETWDGLTVGVILTSNFLQLHLMPISAKGSQPIPLGGLDAKRVLDRMAQTSSPELQTMIQEGLIILPYEKQEQ